MIPGFVTTKQKVIAMESNVILEPSENVVFWKLATPVCQIDEFWALQLPCEVTEEYENDLTYCDEYELFKLN